ncbi:hypothetical protein AAFC00_000693 [Neodothiora populina]
MSASQMPEMADDTYKGEVINLTASKLSANELEGSNKAEQGRLLRKIDLCLLPLLTVSYMLQFLDKQALNFSSIMGLTKDLHLVGTEYNWAASVFYFGYLAFSYPASFLMVRFPLGKYLAITCFIWSICLACHAATTGFPGLVVARFALGAAEASMSPGFSLMTGLFYKREEQPFRHGIWFFGNSVATMFGGLLAYGIAHIDNGLAPWKWLFIIFGLITFAWAVVLFFFLPNTPMDARFFNAEERVAATERVASNKTGSKETRFNWAEAKEAFTDVKVLLLVLYQLANSIPNGAFTSFSSIVFKGFGFTQLEVYLLQIPSGAIHGFFALGSTYLCTRIKGSRCAIAAVLSVISLTASVLVRYGPNLGSRLVGLFLFVAFASGIPISLSMISSNVAGFTKKSVATAMIFIAYCTGNIIGPFLFFPSEAPSYPSGFLATIICFACAMLIMITLRVVIKLENRRRDKAQGIEIGSTPPENTIVTTDRTDKQIPEFRYVY